MSINTVSIRPVDLYDVLPLVCGEGLSAMVWGVPGVGKTMIVEAINLLIGERAELQLDLAFQVFESGGLGRRVMEYQDRRMC